MQISCYICVVISCFIILMIDSMKCSSLLTLDQFLTEFLEPYRWYNGMRERVSRTENSTSHSQALYCWSQDPSQSTIIPPTALLSCFNYYIQLLVV